MTRILIALSFIGLIASLGALPSSAQDYPLEEDVSTLEGILKAYYEVVSGPAGEIRNWDRDKSLHIPEAQVIIVGRNEDGSVRLEPITIGDYHDRQPGPAQSGFWEEEIHRVVQTHGAVTHVWSTYEWRNEPDGPVGGRGVNSIQLVHDGERWWITSWMFDGRPNAPDVPAEYMPDN